MVKPVWPQEEMRARLERKKVIMLTGPREVTAQGRATSGWQGERGTGGVSVRRQRSKGTV